MAVAKGGGAATLGATAGRRDHPGRAGRPWRGDAGAGPRRGLGPPTPADRTGRGAMRYALINPPWTFDGSIYFGCREPHLPLEFGYARALLGRAGHEVLLVDAQAEGLTLGEVRGRVAAFRPDLTAVTTAPSYLFWRCAPPELRVPREAVRAVRDVGGVVVGVGPHGSTTPGAALRKLSADAVVLGECEEVLPRLAGRAVGDWDDVPNLAYWRDGEVRVQGGPHAADVAALPALRW